MSTITELTPSAPPIVATTITLETIQDVLHMQGYNTEGLLKFLYIFSYCYIIAEARTHRAVITLATFDWRIVKIYYYRRFSLK